MDNQNKSKKRDLALKIIIPVLVIAVIAGIWFFKANQGKQEIADIGTVETTADESQETIGSDASVTAAEDPDKTNDTDSSEITADKSEEATGSSSSSDTASSEESQEIADSDTSNTETNENQDQDNTNPDFYLAVKKIDLEKLKSYGLPIIIDFGADSCIPCKEMAPVLKKLNREWRGKVIVKFVDVWKYPDGAADFPLQVIPTQFFFDANGNPYVPSDPEGMQMQMYLVKETEEHVYTAHQGGMTEGQIRAVFKEMGVK